VTTSEFCELLRRREGNRVRVTFADGEIATVTIVHFDDEYSDFVYEVISSNRDRRTDVAYTGKCSDVRAVEDVG
jgi:hypothetical protein